MRDYYAQRASAGLIVTEGTAPSPNGLGLGASRLRGDGKAIAIHKAQSSASSIR